MVLEKIELWYDSTFFSTGNLHYEKVGDGRPVCIEDELPFALPEGWCWSRLGGIGSWQSGATPSRSNSLYHANGTVPWLLTGDLNDGLIRDIPNKITNLALEKTSVKLNPRGSVLIAMYGATIGKLGILDIEATTNQACCACVPFSLIDNRFLFFLLMSLRATFVKKGEGGAQPNISKEKISSTLIPTPPFVEQQRIVAALDDLLAHVDTIEREQAELDELLAKTRSKVLDLAIRGKLVPQDPADEPASALLERIHAEKLQMVAGGKLKKKDVANDSVIYRGDDNSYYEKVGNGEPVCVDDELPFALPDGWCWARIGSLLGTLLSGSDLKPHQYNDKHEGIPYMTGASNVTSGALVVNRWTAEAKNISVAGDLLLTCKGTVGLTAINNIGSIHIARQFMALRTVGVGSLQMTAYLQIILSLIAPMLARQSMGLIPGIDRKTVLNILLALPPLAEQHRIANAISGILPSFLDSENI